MHRAHRWSLTCPPSEVCHLVTFQWYAACLCIICSQTQTAVSTRKHCLRMEAGCCPSTAGSLVGGSQRLPLHWQVHVWLRRPGPSSTKASKAATSMVHHVGRAPEYGAGQGIELKLMARRLAPRCVTTYGHLDALAIVLLTRPCTTHGVLNILVDHHAP